MGWLGRFFGEPAPVSKIADTWGTASEEKRAAVTKAFLESVAAKAGVQSIVIVPKLGDEKSDLRGTLNGFPLRVTVNHFGGIDDITLKCKLKVPFLDLEFSPGAVSTPIPDVDAFDDDDHQIVLGRGVFLSGSRAVKGRAEFAALSAELRARILETMAQRRIRYFRSREDTHEVVMWDDASKIKEPEPWLAAALVLAADVATARGAMPRGATLATAPTHSLSGEGHPRERATAFATHLATKIPGSKVVSRPGDECVDVRWAENGSQVRVILDMTEPCIQASAFAEGVGGDFSLVRDLSLSNDLTQDAQDTSGDWNEADHRPIYFGRGIFVYGADEQKKQEAALLRPVPSDVMDALTTAMHELELEDVSFGDKEIITTISDFDHLDDDGAAAVRMAKILARVAAALPRGELAVERSGEAVRCAFCGALWFPSATRSLCINCGAPP